MKNEFIVFSNGKVYWKDMSEASCGENRINYRFLGHEKDLRPLFEFCQKTDSGLFVDITGKHHVTVETENQDYLEIAIITFKDYGSTYDYEEYNFSPNFIEYAKVSKQDYETLKKYADFNKYRILVKPKIVDIASVIKEAEERKLAEEKRLQAIKDKKKKSDLNKKKKKIEDILSEPELVEELRRFIENKSYYEERIEHINEKKKLQDVFDKNYLDEFGNLPPR